MLDIANSCSQGQYICPQAGCKELWWHQGQALRLPIAQQRESSPGRNMPPHSLRTPDPGNSAFPEKSIRKCQHHYGVLLCPSSCKEHFMADTHSLVQCSEEASLNIPFVLRGTDSSTAWICVIIFSESPFPLKILLGTLLPPFPSIFSPSSQTAHWVPACETSGCPNSSKLMPVLRSPVADEIIKSKCIEIVLVGSLLWKQSNGRDYESKGNECALAQIECKFWNHQLLLARKAVSSTCTILVLYSAWRT